MALLSDYTAGTVTSSGSVITGTGTAWKTAEFREGDWFIANGWVNIVASVDSETQLTLAQPWRGGELTDASYRLRYMSDGSRASAQARQLIDMLGGSGNLEALAGLVSASNMLPYFTGAGTAGITPLTPAARAILALTGSSGAKIPVVTDAGTAALRNIVGTVSQSGGVPTGALVEYGNNTNGNYWRFAGGMQILISPNSLTADIDIPVGSIYRSNIVEWTYPASTTGAVWVDVSNTGNSTTHWGTARGLSVSAQITLWSGNAVPVRGFILTAISRWHA